MKPTVLFRLGMKHLKNHCFEGVYLRTGMDRTRPVAFYALINQRCNSKCRYCDFWRLENYDQELSIPEWQAGLLSIKRFVGSYSINFSGGEPFMKKGFVGLLRWCREQGIQAGVTTNGTLLASERLARQVVQARPFNLSFSMDSPTPEVNDYIRGVDKSHAKALKGLCHVVALKKEMGIDFPVILKPTITALNYQDLPDLVAWADGIGVTSVSMQPVFHWTPETYEDLWIQNAELGRLSDIVDRLIQMKENGYPILNSKKNLALIVDSFLDKKAPPEILPCLVGLRNFTIRPNGDVRMCAEFSFIGNLREQPAKEIWYSDIARKERARTVDCSKLCLLTCTSQKSFWDKFRIAKSLFLKTAT